MTRLRTRTTRKLSRTADRWRASDEIYRDLFENAFDIVFTTDLSGHFLDGNKAVERLLGYTVEEAKGLTWEKLVAPYDMPKATEVLKRHAKGEQHINYDLDTITKSGEIRTFEIGSRPIFDCDKIIGFHGIARDITERKRLQQQLIEARRQAEQANCAKSTFLANMSHEIRTPIHGLLGFMSLMAKTALDADQREYLRPMQQSADALLKIINDVLDFSKIEAGQLIIENEPLDLPSVLEAAVSLSTPIALEKDLRLSLTVDPAIPKQLRGDATRIGQVVSNLVNNAVKFTDEGEVRVQATLSALATTQVDVLIVISDTGIGLTPEEQVRLRAPFQQSNSRMDRRHGGTGLGLTITQNLVAAMGGRFDLESRPGQYTKASVRLPLTASGNATADQVERQPANSCRFEGSGLSLLVVDDNEINRRFLSELLRRCRCAVSEAGSGREALTMCDTCTFNMVLMDIHMADLDGIRTTQLLKRANTVNRYTPIIAVSADVLDGNGHAFMNRGLDGFLSKPVTELALMNELERWFPGRRSVSPADLASADGSQTVVVLDVEAGVQLASGDRELWQRSVYGLLEGLPEQIRTMRKAAEHAALPCLQNAAHAIAGGAEYVAAQALARAARQLETMCGQGRADAVTGALRQVTYEAGRLRRRLERRRCGRSVRQPARFTASPPRKAG